ncbi:H-NS family nucleoid-associated regulatory protein, partial [Klebsiella pneumoniae]|nr:H-NS family nucleoid-associated regulatory protein [Klebsiella pneumoniae]
MTRLITDQTGDKYRDPKSGATWTGHDRAPGWIASAKNRDKFLVVGTAATANPVPVSKSEGCLQLC